MKFSNMQIENQKVLDRMEEMKLIDHMSDFYTYIKLNKKHVSESLKPADDQVSTYFCISIYKRTRMM